MTMRFVAFGLVLVGFAGCAPVVPESGTSFDGYQSYAADREAQLTGQPIPSQQPPAGFDPARVGAAIDAAEQVSAPLSAIPPGAPSVTVPVQSGAVSSGPVAQDSAYGAIIGSTAPLAADRPRGNAPAGIAVETGETIHSNPGISDEQDFNAVSSRETIESDKERIARNKAQYTVVEPTALPERTGGDTGPDIVKYAINTKNAVGEQIYSRSSIRLGSADAACKRYHSPDLAQEAFLKSGGPERDPKGLDPDGDGFACRWDPGPFRTALQ